MICGKGQSCGRKWTVSACPQRSASGPVFERVPPITLQSIANNRRTDDIWEKWQASSLSHSAAIARVEHNDRTSHGAFMIYEAPTVEP
jgi:hypothetical protein